MTTMVIGGGEDRSGERRILREVVRLAGGSGRMVVLGVASAEPGSSAAEYRRIFLELGAAEVLALAPRDRSEVMAGPGEEALRTAEGIFFTGGDQLRITALLGGSPWLSAIREAHARGALLAGTSAGASAMSATMVIGGSGDASPRSDLLAMAPGLGFLPGMVIDQHFAQRGRISRLLLALAKNPELLGVGLDEDTALIVEGETARVLGSRTVTVLDGRGLEVNNVSELSPAEPLALDGVRLSVLPDGYRYQLPLRRVTAPA